MRKPLRHEHTLPSKRPTPHEIVWQAFEYYSSLKKVASYRREHPTESLTLAEAATIAGLERTYFSKFFRQKTGVNFKFWNDLTRIDRAASRLLESDDSITKVAEDSGFETLATFERTFYRIKGLMPKDWRRRTQELTKNSQEVLKTSQ